MSCLNWFCISSQIIKSSGVCNMLAKHIKILTELIEFSIRIAFVCSWHYLPLRLRSVILKFIGQNAFEETILAPSFMLANLNFN